MATRSSRTMGSSMGRQGRSMELPHTLDSSQGHSSSQFSSRYSPPPIYTLLVSLPHRGGGRVNPGSNND